MRRLAFIRPDVSWSRSLGGCGPCCGLYEKNRGIVKLRASANDSPLPLRRLVKHGFLDELTCEFACACGIAPVVKRRFDVGYDHAQDT